MNMLFTPLKSCHYSPPQVHQRVTSEGLRSLICIDIGLRPGAAPHSYVWIRWWWCRGLSSWHSMLGRVPKNSIVCIYEKKKYIIYVCGIYLESIAHVMTTKKAIVPNLRAREQELTKKICISYWICLRVETYIITSTHYYTCHFARANRISAREQDFCARTGLPRANRICSVLNRPGTPAHQDAASTCSGLGARGMYS